MDALTKWSAPVATKVRRRLTFKQLALVAFAYVGGNVTPISPHIAGFVAEILVTDNQRVDAGQVLVRLDDRDARAAAEHAEAVLNQRTAMLASLRAKYALQQPTIEQAAADLDAKVA